MLLETPSGVLFDAVAGVEHSGGIVPWFVGGIPSSPTARCVASQLLDPDFSVRSAALAYLQASPSLGGEFTGIGSQRGRRKRGVGSQFQSDIAYNEPEGLDAFGLADPVSFLPPSMASDLLLALRHVWTAASNSDCSALALPNHPQDLDPSRRVVLADL